MKRLNGVALILCLQVPLWGTDVSTSAQNGSCQEVNASSGCASASPAGGPAPAWEKELEKARKAGEACQADIEKFCEGVQVGEGRIEACLKANQKKVSKDCRKAQGFTK